MPSDPKSKIESLLDAYARRRRDAGGSDSQMDPLTRRLLQDEVRRRYGSGSAPAKEPERRSRLSGLFQWWPRLTLAASLTVVLAASIWIFNRNGPARSNSRENFADASATSPKRKSLSAESENVPAAPLNPLKRELASARTATAPTSIPAGPATDFGEKDVQLRMRPNPASAANSPRPTDSANRDIRDERNVSDIAGVRSIADTKSPTSLPPAPRPENLDANPSEGALRGAAMTAERRALVVQAQPTPTPARPTPAQIEDRAAPSLATTEPLPTIQTAPAPAPSPSTPLTLEKAVAFDRRDRYQEPTTAGRSVVQLYFRNQSGAEAPSGELGAGGASDALKTKLDITPLAQSTRIKSTTQPATTPRSAAAAQPPATVLVNFSVEQEGSTVRFIDEDGSIYAGFVSNASTNVQAQQTQQLSDFATGTGSPQKAAKFGFSAGAVAGNGGTQSRGRALAETNGLENEVSFQVIGTNQTLRQRVTVVGSLILGVPNAANVTYSDALTERLYRTPAQNAPNASPPLNGAGAVAGSANGAVLQYQPVVRVLGRGQLGTSNELRIDAVPAKR